MKIADMKVTELINEVGRGALPPPAAARWQALPAASAWR